MLRKIWIVQHRALSTHLEIKKKARGGEGPHAGIINPLAYEDQRGVDPLTTP